MNTERLKHHALVFFAIVFILALGLLAYFNFLDGKVFRVPITYGTDQLSIVTDKTEYRRGEMVRGHIQFCKMRDVKTTVQWSMVDGVLTIYPTKESYVGKGCKEVDFDIEKIPKNAVIEDGVHFEGLIQYQVNPFSVISIPLKTVTFDIQQ